VRERGVSVVQAGEAQSAVVDVSISTRRVLLSAIWCRSIGSTALHLLIL
jgi:hypothetical protein